MSAIDFKPVDGTGQTMAPSEDLVEIQMLLSVGQLAQLADTAHQHRMTAVELVRRLIYDFLSTARGSR